MSKKACLIKIKKARELLYKVEIEKLLMKNRVYIAIDLKSYYASVECMDRGLDPLTTNLVVADKARTSKTICLAVSPALKAIGIPGRPRLFEVEQKIQQANNQRLAKLKGKEFAGASSSMLEVEANPDLAIDYIVAVPRMARYIKLSSEIYKIYLKYIAREDIYVYSIDEVFIDVTNYLNAYKMTAHQLALTIIRDVLATTNITATAGIGTNMYLCKVAMDILAKHVQPDKDGVRIAVLDELSYRKQLWNHTPITDFWRVGRGTARKLEKYQLFTMGDIARCSLGRKTDFYNADLLFKLFGVNAELLIDHAWGYEPCTITQIKGYVPEHNCICSGQVLDAPYSYAKGKLIVREMVDLLVLNLVAKGFVCNQITLTIGYDVENLRDSFKAERYHGEIHVDRYGRRVPKHAHGTVHLSAYTSSTKEIVDKTMELYARIMNQELLLRRVALTANNVVPEDKAPKGMLEEIDLFAEPEAIEKKERILAREKRLQQAIIMIQKKYGKNGILKGMNFEEGAKTIERNSSIGGHRA